MFSLAIRLLGFVVFALAGWGLTNLWEVGTWGWAVVGGGGIVGFGIAPFLTIYPLRWVVRKAHKAPAYALAGGTVGLVCGLVVAALLALPLSMLPGLWGIVLPIAVTFFLAYLGIALMVERGRELWQALSASFPGGGQGRNVSANGSGKVILDTSAIIDGRIADISQTGFIPGTLLIPRFVLDELRHIADSSDAMRRNRGRRGLDMLTKLQKESDVPIQIADADMENGMEADAKLVKLARTLHCSIITNDFNLNRVAELQGVRVLNVNELANAVKPVVLPGEEMSLRVIQEGKELGQGVGFLDDGTMVVVEGGRRYINSQINVLVTRVLQTAAGRMIFAQPKGPS